LRATGFREHTHGYRDNPVARKARSYKGSAHSCQQTSPRIPLGGMRADLSRRL